MKALLVGLEKICDNNPGTHGDGGLVRVQAWGILEYFLTNYFYIQ
jgi:hypothetical protein